MFVFRQDSLRYHMKNEHPDEFPSLQHDNQIKRPPGRPPGSGKHKNSLTSSLNPMQTDLRHTTSPTGPPSHPDTSLSPTLVADSRSSLSPGGHLVHSGGQQVQSGNQPGYSASEGHSVHSGGHGGQSVHGLLPGGSPPPTHNLIPPRYIYCINLLKSLKECYSSLVH